MGENVPGLVSWNGGMVFEEVQTDLEAEGYEVQAVLLPACGIDAPHRRERVWFVAHANRKPREQSFKRKERKQGQERESIRNIFASDGKKSVASNANNTGSNELLRDNGNRKEENEGWEKQSQSKHRTHGSDGTYPNAYGIRQPRQEYGEKKSRRTPEKSVPRNWENFPTVSPIRVRNDGVPCRLVRFVEEEFYDTDSYTSEENRIKNVPEVQKRISQEEVWEKIRGLYSLESKEILLQTVQLYSSKRRNKGELSPFSSKVSKRIMQQLSRKKEFRFTPHGRKLEKQRSKEFGDSLSFLPHEVALAARRFETQLTKFETWHINESIKAGGNAIVPGVVFEIFKVIKKLNNQLT